MNKDKPTVLVVDDVADNIQVLLSALKNDFSVLAATNGKDAIELSLSDHQLDIILLDVLMPEMDGYEVCRRLKAEERTEDIPVIFITILDENESELKGLELGAVDYITKPIIPELVRARIFNHIELKRHRDNLQEMLKEKDLREANKQYESIVEDLGDNFFAYRLDSQSILVYTSQNIEQVLGIAPEDIVGKNFTEAIDWSGDSIPLAIKSLEEYFTGAREKDVLIMSFIHPSCKEEKFIKVSNHCVKDEENNIKWFDGIVEDITEQKIYEQALEQAKYLADKANKSKSEFLANMSHEIRTPMNGILGFVDQLAKSETEPERQKQFEIIKNSSTTLLSIINDILDFSKIESGSMEIESHPYNVYKFCHEITDVFSELTNNKKITLNKNIDENIPKCLLIDQVRIKQVIFNLLSNAVKFTPEGGEITLNSKYDINTNTLSCSISDTGIGIAKDKQTKIFEAFGQEDASTTRKFGGTGLGLSISSKLISMMGGELKVESELNKGSRFYFTIPLSICKEQTNEVLQDNANDKNTIIKGNVLIVEDNKTNQMLMSIILDETDVSYDIANDGIEALDKYKHNSYDIILMDENMPNMNGIEATKQIRQIEKENSKDKTTIVAVTANALSEDRQRFLDAGMDDYLSKPYTEDAVIGVLRKYLG